MFEINPKEIAGKFQMYFKGGSRKFQGCSKKVFGVLQGHFKGVNRKFQECFKEVTVK